MGEVYYGDNLRVLRDHIADESVDLVYLDPPFKSNQDYHVLSGVNVKTAPGAAPPAGKAEREGRAVRAFGDIWTWSEAAETAYSEVALGEGRIAKAMQALRALIGETDMLAYLAMMAPRLVELRRVLKPTGSIYLHCDPTASHYLKLFMDAVFGPPCFRNEIIWRYRRWPARSRQFQKMHDVLLFYSKSPGKDHHFNTLYGYEKLAESTLKTFGLKRQVADFSSGHRKPGRETEDSLGPPLSDVWDVGIIAPSGRERLGYPTQKPEALLERIILASSREGDLVLDPFCGSGTTLVVAEREGRRWIGADTSYVAINLLKRRMQRSFGERGVPVVLGAPATMADVETLARRDPEQLRWWALDLLGARGLEEKRRAPGGGKPGAARLEAGGRLFFRDGEGPVEHALIAVQPEIASVGDIRALRAAMAADRASIAVLITLTEPAEARRREAAEAGFYRAEGRGTSHPRVQILTVAELLAGKRIDAPKNDHAEAPESERGSGRGSGNRAALPVASPPRGG